MSSRLRLIGRPAFRAVLFICLAATFTGCTAIQSLLPAHREAERRVAELRTLQVDVMRYADEYAGRVGEAAEKYQATATTPEDRLHAQNWRNSQSLAAFTIGSGVDSMTNALDWVVFATLSRMVIEDVWTGAAAPSRVQPLLATHRDLESKAWTLVSGSLTDSQSTQLREIIGTWRREHPQVRAVGYVHFTEFARSIGLPKGGEERNSSNLFSLLGIDPFSTLDPAVRELNQTRELAERSIYYLQRTPRLLSMQVERLVYQMAVMPESKALLADLDRVSLIGSAADRLSTSFPEVVARERSAAIAQLTSELERSSRSVQTLSGDIRSTLIAGGDTARALEAALGAAEGLRARLAPHDNADTLDRPRRPFDAREYTELLRQLSMTTQALASLLQQAEESTPLLQSATQGAVLAAHDLQDRMFRQLLILIGIALLAALAYRWLVERLIVRRS